MLDPSLIPAPPAPAVRAYRPRTPFEEGDFRSILAGCRAMRQLAEQPAEQSEPLWLNAAALAATCADGEQAFHDFSQGYPGYAPAETTAKFAHAAAFVDGEGGPPRCDTIRENGGSCEGCPFAGKLTSPAQLGRVDTNLVRIASEYVHVDGGVHRISDIAEMGGGAPLISRQDLDMREGGGVASAWSGLKSLSFARKGQKLLYRPGKGRFLDENTTNLWSPTDLVPIAGEFPNIRAVLSNLFGEGEYRSYFERLLAYHVRNPGEQTSVILYLTSRPGAGKDSLVDMLSLLVGGANLRRIGADILDGKFGIERVNNQILVVNEVQGIRDPVAVAGRLKELSGAALDVQAEAKGKGSVACFAPRLTIYCSNDAVPIPTDENCRRTFAPPRVTDELPPDVGVFMNAPHFREARRAEAAAFLDYLWNTVDLTGFDLRRMIPDSDVRQAMIRAGKPSLHLTLKRGMDFGETPFDRGVVKATALLAYILEAGEKRPANPLLSETMRLLGWQSLGQKTLGGGEKASLWCPSSEFTRWSNASPKELWEELYGPLPPVAFTPACLATNNPKTERV